MNKMMIIGNLTRDPELRSMADGSVVCNFTVAVNRKGGNGHPEADFFRVAAWGRLGESCAQYLGKGKKVYVAGLLRVRLYEDNKRETRTELGITAAEVEFLTPRERGSEQAQDAAAGDGSPAYTPVDDEDVPF